MESMGEKGIWWESRAKPSLC